MDHPRNRLVKNRLTREPPPEEESPEPIEQLEESARAFQAVDHKPANCPNCGSCNNKIVKTAHPTPATVKRIHRCDGCKKLFTSLQELSRVDVGT